MTEVISPKFVTYVQTIGRYDKGPPAPLDVVFYGHAAVFDLERDHPCFSSWLSMLKESQGEGRTIVFTHTTVGMRIRSVEPGDHIVGVVREVFEDETDFGFKISKYAHIFEIPRSHPQLSSWLSMLKKSHDERIRIVVQYDAYNRRVTSLALAED